MKKEGIAPSGTVIKFSKLGEFAYQGPTNSSTSGSTTSTTTATTSSTAAPTGSDTTETTVLPTVQIRFDIMLSNSHEYKVKLTATSADNTYNQEVNATGSLAISAVFNDVPANSDYQYTVIRIQGNQVQRTGTINVATNDVVILIKDD